MNDPLEEKTITAQFTNPTQAEICMVRLRQEHFEPIQSDDETIIEIPVTSETEPLAKEILQDLKASQIFDTVKSQESVREKMADEAKKVLEIFEKPPS